jgi:cbb3-type cytochrome oxidase maturation protein
MEVLTLLIPLALILGLLFLVLFIWAAKKGQFDDLDTPAKRMLFEEHSNKRKDD